MQLGIGPTTTASEGWSLDLRKKNKMVVRLPTLPWVSSQCFWGAAGLKHPTQSLTGRVRLYYFC